MAAVLMVGVTLLASTPASAEDRGDWGTIQLTETGAEPGASGVATLAKVNCTFSFSYTDGEWWNPYPDVHEYREYRGHLTVTCHNLNSGATYWTPAGTFKADRTGTGTASGKVDFVLEYGFSTWSGEVGFSNWLMVDVIRLDSDGSSVTALKGDFFPPWYVD
jgi:hypothetical protein